MDFFSIQERQKNGLMHLYPDFKVKSTKHLMIRGRSFYAVWDDEKNLWSRKEEDLVRLVDRDIRARAKEEESRGRVVMQDLMEDYRTGVWTNYLSYVKGMYDIYKPLDQKVVYLNQETTYKDYASKRLPYDLEDGEPEAYNELMSTLYSKEERRKLEWAIGAILNGDGAYIQKFIVLYGEAGSGKSTFLHIVEALFDGYWVAFNAKNLASAKNSFSTAFMKDNPLVAIQHDGDLSKIEDNTLLNSIISHEDIEVNEKFKAQYTDRSNAFIFMGTNSPVKITDSKSGLIRRLIDVVPSGRTIDNDRYNILMDQIQFELGRIARKCLNLYRRLGKRYYEKYRPIGMMYETDAFYNFVTDNMLFFEDNDPLELQHAYDLYCDYCERSHANYVLQRYKFRNELKTYYEHYDEKKFIFSGFLRERFETAVEERLEESEPLTMVLDKTWSTLDIDLKNCPAQYGNADEVPFDKWENVTRTLKEIDSHKLHYVRPPENHIVIDFDLKNEKGEKDKLKNLRAAERFPKTYAEFSKGGNGVHLHYIYDGDVSTLSRIYSEGIEIKVFTGKSSLRRKLTLCNNLPVAHLSSGLPLKESEKVISTTQINDEKHLRALIMKALRKEIWPNTKPSIDFIYRILEDSYNSGMVYDVQDLYQKVLVFAMKSTNQRTECLAILDKMHFCSEKEGSPVTDGQYADERLVFFDIEVFPNLLLVNWKYQGDANVVRMINPSPKEIGELFKYKLVGFNNTRYDNYILYARYMGKSNAELFDLSQKIIVKKENPGYREAKDISYTDVFDFASKKQSLKKWEIELKIHHQELPLPWDQPVPEDRWEEVARYCDNDVISTEKVFDALQSDWMTRNILVDLCNASGVPATVNESTNELVGKFVFLGKREPELWYTDLKTGKQYRKEAFSYA